MAGPVRFRIKGTASYVEPLASTAYEGASQAPRVVRWRPTTGGPNATLRGSLQLLRSRSRDIVRRDSFADNAVEVLVSNIIGTGIKPQFSTPDGQFNRALAKAWLDWTDEADADGRLDFYGLQALAVRSMIEGGDAFGRFRVRRPGDGLTVPLQIQVLEGEFCPDDKNETTATGNLVRCGVEFNAFGQRVAYHIFRQHPYDQLFTGFADAFPARVPASEVLHLARILRPGLIRGEPWLTRALIKLQDLDKYDDGQLVRQQIAALFAGFVKTEAPDDDGTSIVAGQEAPDDDGVALASLEPGTMQVLRPGESMDWSEPPDPGNAYVDFMRQQLRGVAVAAGILYEQLTGDYNQINDRTFRAAVNEFRRRCETWQHHLVVFQFCRPILARWAAYAVLAGTVKPPAGITPEQIAKAAWVPQGWAYINPMQDIQAKKAEIRAGLKSRKQAVSETGNDVEQVDEEIAADNARADDLGIVLDSDARKVSDAGLTQARPAGSALPGDGSGGTDE